MSEIHQVMALLGIPTVLGFLAIVLEIHNAAIPAAMNGNTQTVGQAIVLLLFLAIAVILAQIASP